MSRVDVQFRHEDEVEKSKDEYAKTRGHRTLDGTIFIFLVLVTCSTQQIRNVLQV